MSHPSLRPDDVITLPQAARLLGVGPTTLKRWSDQGRIPHTRTPGGHRRFLRSVILDFRAVVDPRAGLQAASSAPTLNLGAVSAWADRANTLADADRMEAALRALRATSLGWGPLADELLADFVHVLGRRHHDGRLSAGSWCALERSLSRSVQRLSGQLRPRVGAPVALVASVGGHAGPAMLALAEAVLREAGFTVLDVGCLQQPGVLEEIIAEQQPHQVVLLADADAHPGELVPRLQGVGRAAARRGAGIWLVGAAPWPLVDGARRVPTFTALGDHAEHHTGLEGRRQAR